MEFGSNNLKKLIFLGLDFFHFAQKYEIKCKSCRYFQFSVNICVLYIWGSLNVPL